MREHDIDPVVREANHASPASPSRRTLLHGATLAGGLALTSCAAARAKAGASTPRRPGDALDEADARLDEMFADLTDQRSGARPITPDDRAARRARLGAILRGSGVDAFLCEGGPTMSYLSGVPWGLSERLFALVVLADGTHFWLCPSFEAEKARLKIDVAHGASHPGGEIVTWEEDAYAFKPLAAALRARRVERVALASEARWFVAANLASEIGMQHILDGRSIAIELRGRKDDKEIALLRRANELTQQAIAAVARTLQPGLSGRDVADRMHHAQRRLGLERTWCLALVGPAAAYPHGEELERKIERGDLLLVDTGGSFLEYQSDISRTWSVGAALQGDPLAAWRAVRDAQQRAFEAIRPGVEAREVDRAARDSLVASGYPGGFEVLTHRLGHGIGIEGHEDPYFDGGSRVPLAPGMTLSNEPGIYLYGRFGVRLEDIVLVTEDGADHFGAWQSGPDFPA